MRLVLRRTLEEIQEHNRRATSLNILRVVNLVPPRSWVFGLTFEADNSTNLRVRCTPDLTVEEFAEIADGRIPEVFHCGFLQFSHDSISVEGRIDDDRVNLVDLNEVDGTDEAGVLFRDFALGTLPPELARMELVSEFVYRHTWLGSEFLAKSNPSKELVWSVYGDELRLSPDSWIKDADYAHFRADLEVQVNNVSCQVCLFSPMANGDIRVRHSRLGSMEGLPECSPRVIRELGGAGMGIEINEPATSYGSSLHLGPVSHLRSLLKSAAALVEGQVRTQQFEVFKSELVRKKVENAADKLRERQEAAKQRSFAYFGDLELGCSPRSENEVMLLMAKLEMMKCLPFRYFRLIEYTPKSGIDALAHFQIDAYSLVHQFAPIELEFHFESFIQHEHPIQQVALIVCWDFRSAATRDALDLVQGDDGLYQYTTEDGSCPVLVLSQLHAITERRPQ